MLSASASSTCVSRLRPALGTFVGFEAHAPRVAQAVAAIDAATIVISQIDALLHPHRSSGDLAALSTAELGVPLQVHPWTFELLDLCKTLHRASKGVFDPCLPDASGCMEDVELREPNRVVVHVPVKIDLGGIAKGFAVDQAIESMRRAGCSSALVNAGGDMRASGALSFAISYRSASGHVHDVSLRDSALAVSHRNNVDAPVEHRGYYSRVASAESALVDSVAILAPSAALADALTKFALLIDETACSEILRSFHASRLF